jgi:hypothetical protein
MKNNHQVCFDILNLKILFSSRINMNIFFNFVKTLNKDYMFKVGCLIDEILHLSFFLINGVSKCTCGFSSFSHSNKNIFGF